MKVTKEQFKKFEDYCYEWQKELGLTDWHIYVFNDDLEDVFANCATSTCDRAARITLNTKWNDREITDKNLRSCALHEVLHIVTAPLLNEAKARYADEYSMDAAEHSVVVRIANILEAR